MEYDRHVFNYVGLSKGIDEDFNLFKPELPLVEKNIKDGFVQPFADNPLDDEPVGNNLYEPNQ